MLSIIHFFLFGSLPFLAVTGGVVWPSTAD